MMRIITKATAIQFIDEECHIKKRKSRKTALSGYYAYRILGIIHGRKSLQIS